MILFLLAPDNPFVPVAACRSPAEAHLARALLESCGIESRLRDEFTVSAHLYLSNAVGGIKVMVRQSEAAEALAILDTPVQADAPIPTCPGCGSSDCQAERAKLLALIFIVLAIDLPPPLTPRYTCRACGKRW